MPYAAPPLERMLSDTRMLTHPPAPHCRFSHACNSSCDLTLAIPQCIACSPQCTVPMPLAFALYRAAQNLLAQSHRTIPHRTTPQHALCRVAPLLLSLIHTRPSCSAAKLVHDTGVTELHGSLRKLLPSAMAHRPTPPIYMGVEKINCVSSEFELRVTDVERVAAVVAELAESSYS